jgi:anti-sigma factor ChrR (cupin superfamily)
MLSSPSPLVIRDLLQRAAQLRDEPGWEPFRPGIQIQRLYQTDECGPAAALLRYEPGTGVPTHTHLGYEHVLILDGAQSDEHGSYPAGTFIINGPQSRHRVTSDAGCVVLIIWEAGVRFQAPVPDRTE